MWKMEEKNIQILIVVVECASLENHFGEEISCWRPVTYQTNSTKMKEFKITLCKMQMTLQENTTHGPGPYQLQALVAYVVSI